MTDNKPIVPAPAAEALLALLERDSRLLHEYICTPPAQLSPEDLRRHISRMFSFAESLCEIAEQHRAAHANANGETSEQNHF